MNETFEAAGISPLKLHGFAKQRKVKIAKNKLTRVHTHHEEEIAKVIGVDPEEIKPGTSSDSLVDKETKEKAAEYGKFFQVSEYVIRTARTLKRERESYLSLSVSRVEV